MRSGAIAATCAVALCVSRGAVRADETGPLLQPTERVAATGWFAEGGLGAVGFLPGASSDAAVGPSIDLRFGRDLANLTTVASENILMIKANYWIGL